MAKTSHTCQLFTQYMPGDRTFAETTMLHACQRSSTTHRSETSTYTPAFYAAYALRSYSLNQHALYANMNTNYAITSYNHPRKMVRWSSCASSPPEALNYPSTCLSPTPPDPALTTTPCTSGNASFVVLQPVSKEHQHSIDYLIHTLKQLSHSIICSS